MRKLFPIALCILLFAACNSNTPEPKGQTVNFTETEELFPNPEKGWLIQKYYTSADLDSHLTLNGVKLSRDGDDHVTVYLHSYYLTDYMESDIPQAFFDRLELNMQALREGGAKAVLRFSYKSDESSKPWNASPEWLHKHIDQIAPYLQKHADVIMCVQCGLLGVWGEWYYTDNGYKQNPSKDSDFEMRWEVLEHMLRVVPEDRQVALRTPMFKRRYLKMRGDSTASPLTEAEAFKPTFKARICGHNDCFVSSDNDYGTYSSPADRDFWAEDSKYTLMGGETCQKCRYSTSEYAISEMERYHWTYLHRDYQKSVINLWRSEGAYPVVQRRLGYRLVLEKVVMTAKPVFERPFEMYCVLHNRGFAAPMNPRDVELVFVNANDPSEKHVFKQSVDPRFWLPEEEHKFTLSCTLTNFKEGQYKVYINLPDHYASLHNDPKFSIRLANENVWEEATGYNYITTINVAGLPD